MKEQQDRHEIILSNLIRNIETGDKKDRLYAIGELADYPSRRPIPVLVLALVDLDAEVREAAEKRLEAIDPRWKEEEAIQSVIPPLIHKLSSVNEKLIRLAFRMLVELAGRAVPFLLAYLDEEGESMETKAQVIKLLGKIEESEEQVTPKLLELSVSREKTIVEATLVGLMSRASLNEEQLGYPIQNIQHESYLIRIAVLKLLAKHATTASSYIDQITQTLFDINSDVRKEAQHTLNTIGEPTIEVICQYLGQKEDLRKAVEEVINTKYRIKFEGTDRALLYGYYSQAKASLEWHGKDLTDEIWRIEDGLIQITHLLQSFGIINVAIAQVLVKAMNDINPNLRKAGAQALVKLDPDGIYALDLLLAEDAYAMDYPLIFLSLEEMRPGWQMTEAGQDYLIRLAENTLDKDQEYTKTILQILATVDQPIVEAIIRKLNALDTPNPELLALFSKMDQYKTDLKALRPPSEKKEAPKTTGGRRRIGFRTYDED